jgi:hypothetical protein
LFWKTSFITVFMVFSMTVSARAATIYAVQAGNNNLVRVDSLTGLITNVGLLPAGRNAGDSIQGLTGMGDGTLLYTDGNSLAGVWQLNPLNASIIASYALPGVSSRGGLSFEAGTLYSVNDGSPVVSQASLGGAVNFSFANIGEAFPGALGGDDNGRLFGQSGSAIRELHLTTGAVINSFSSPLGVTPSGLAFDGTFLYASSTQNNLLFTLNPNTGAIIHQAVYVGGSLAALAALPQAVPEPASLLLLGAGLAGLAVTARRRVHSQRSPFHE